MPKAWTSLVKQLRQYRKIHRILGLMLAVFIIVISLSGIFLAWKKQFSALQPPTQKASAPCEKWLAVEELTQYATKAIEKKIGTPSIDRIDIRPDKGVAKVRFEQKHWEVQINGCTGEVLSVAKRHSDWIEGIHDGSIISDSVKLIIMNATGIGLIIMTLSGFILWYGPRRLRKLKNRKQYGR